ncbi:MAG TPA: hypothetical protein VEU54_06190 [Steroidobacteraceae bacterium]|nr:hypothetical protein [Steroidobacteraceae bacterium]
MLKRLARCATRSGGGHRPRARRTARTLGCAVLLVSLAGCSLVSLRSPERPLSTRDLNARILTRELSAQFIAAVGRCAQDIATSEHDPAVFDNSLRWEIAAVAESRRAATRAAPMMSLLDTWALAVQMQAFAAPGGAGAALFGAHQQQVRAVSDQFADDAQALARRLTGSGEFADYQRFVAGYARDHPLQDLRFARASVVELWSREKGADTKLVDTLGTIPQAMADASERLEIYGDTVPAQAMRRTQLALREAGYSGNELQASLRRLDERLAQLSTVAQSTPQLLHDAEEQVRQSVRDVLGQLEQSSRATAQALRSERVALFADLQAERVAVVAAVDVQRRALSADAARIATQVVKESGEQARALTREALLLLGALTVIVLGLPFAAGYLLGRARSARAPGP